MKKRIQGWLWRKEAPIVLSERRKDKRLVVAYAVVCRSARHQSARPSWGCTRDVSAGGLYFRTTAGCFRPGEVLRLDLVIPARSGVLEDGGRVSCWAEVLRREGVSADVRRSRRSRVSYGVAVQFCERPRLSI